MKLVTDEPETPSLRAYLDGAALVASELVLTEVPRAIRRAADDDRSLPLDDMLAIARQLLEALALRAVDRAQLIVAGAFAEPVLRALDAVHVAAALDLSPLDAFVSYDRRQAAVARLAGLRTVAPGA